MQKKRNKVDLSATMCKIPWNLMNIRQTNKWIIYNLNDEWESAESGRNFN